MHETNKCFGSLTPRSRRVSCAPISSQELDERLPRRNMKRSLSARKSEHHQPSPFIFRNANALHSTYRHLQIKTINASTLLNYFEIATRSQDSIQSPQAPGSLHRSARQKYTTNQQLSIASDNREDSKAVVAAIYPSPNYPRCHFEWLGCTQSESLSLSSRMRWEIDLTGAPGGVKDPFSRRTQTMLQLVLTTTGGGVLILPIYMRVLAFI